MLLVFSYVLYGAGMQGASGYMTNVTFIYGKGGQPGGSTPKNASRGDCGERRERRNAGCSFPYSSSVPSEFVE